MKIIPAVFFAVLTVVLTGLSTPAHAASKTASSTLTIHEDQVAVEKRVREYFADAPAMIEIARCESKFRQYTDSDSVLRGGAGGGMVGVFQFYETIHAPAAKALGFDLTTLDGNLAYAKHIYESEGTTPWNSARACFETPALSETVTSSTPPTRTELKAKIKQLIQLITLLQQLQELKAMQK